MLVMVGNLLVFAVIIIVICTVDLSTITLDESTERLLYETVENTTEKNAPESAMHVESGIKGDPEDVTPDIMDFDPQMELDRMTEGVFTKNSDEIKERIEFPGLDGGESVSPFAGNIDAKALQEAWDNAGKPESADSTRPDVEDVGMNADFTDDFDTEDILEDIYNAR